MRERIGAPTPVSSNTPLRGCITVLPPAIRSDRDAAALEALLKANKVLVELDLSHNSIGAEAVAALARAGSSRLARLNLSHNGLRGLEAGEALRQFVLSAPDLIHLQVGMNRLGDEGGPKLAEAMRSSSRLAQLSAPNNGFGDQSAYAIGAALGSNTTMSSLTLWGNPAISVGARAVVSSAWGDRGGLLVLDE